MKTNNSTMKEIGDSVLRNRIPLYRVLPGSPFAVVSFSYLAVLLLFILAVAVF